MHFAIYTQAIAANVDKNGKASDIYRNELPLVLRLSKVNSISGGKTMRISRSECRLMSIKIPIKERTVIGIPLRRVKNVI